MNTDQLIAKKVTHKFNGKETLFCVESLNEHFDGLLIHETDIDDDNHVKVGDIGFDTATPNDVTYEASEEGTVGIATQKTPEEVDAEIKEANAKIKQIEVVVDVPAPKKTTKTTKAKK